MKAKAFSAFLRNDKDMEPFGFMVDITPHLNDLNVELQGEKHALIVLTIKLEILTKISKFAKYW